MKLNMMSIYFGKKHKAAKIALRELARRGVTLRAWDVLKILEEQGVDVSEAKKADIATLERRIQEVREELRAIDEEGIR